MSGDQQRALSGAHRVVMTATYGKWLRSFKARWSVSRMGASGPPPSKA
jgi:hypothetical protein